ncbi:ABC transporter ATP-binding protein [Streptomyces sp. AC536]|uniref:ATP-binding cassette domain-containing protein n=1 Tax=Streptomyces buecherae TaxID=2763006 RepID=UPI00164DF848|nr:ABC transporter ATP-binding protein [Streptomyces buecherae]MBC3986462.1 ABC transporter ATP-binding protein [Streptomyces buecherae]QNJ39687.1 ABC transporter ATP-binding protein [Streptomyces buecherae]
MIQAIGLTSAPRRNQPPVVDDLTFEARPGLVTVLFGAPGAGKSTALRLLLQLESGRGLALFRGRPLHRVPHPAREVGVVLGDVPGHPARTARRHLGMLTAAAGVPVGRADEVLELVGLSSLAEQRLGDYSRGMDRRLGLACALLGDPHALVLDEPVRDLSPRETTWLHGLLRGYADQGGAVLVTTSEPRGLDRFADRVISVEGGRLAADQSAADFARTRLRPRVVVRSPFADRLAALLAQEARATGERIEVVPEGSGRIAVYGSSCAAVGELAYRNGILVHRLADEFGVPSLTTPGRRDADRRQTPAQAPERVTLLTRAGDSPEHGTAPVEALPEAARLAVADEPACASQPDGPVVAGRGSWVGFGGAGGVAGGGAPWPTPADEPTSPGRGVPASRALTLTRFPPPGPAWPVRYELRRVFGVSTAWYVAAATLVASLLAGALLARTGDAAAARLFTGWPRSLPLPPVAVGAGLLGALAFGQEYRYPALAPTQGAVPRRLALLGAKSLVWSGGAVLLATIAALANGAALWVLYGPDVARPPADWPALLGGWCLLAVGCAWVGLLAAAVLRSTLLGLGAALTVPLLALTFLRRAVDEPSARSLAGMSDRVRAATLVEWPSLPDRGLALAARLASEPVAHVMALSISVLLCAYVLTALRGRPRPVRVMRWQRAK